MLSLIEEFLVACRRKEAANSVGSTEETEAWGGTVGCGNALQAGRSRVRFPMDIIGIVH